jgi:hypothetical protein
LLCCALGAAGTLLLAFSATERSGEPPKLALDVYPLLEEELAKFPEVEGRNPGVHQVAFLGDSMLMDTPRSPGVPWHVEQLTNGALARTAIAVHGLVIPGSDAFDYYFSLDEILKVQPNVVVISFNLTSLSDTWREAFARPELAGLLAPRRIPAALRLPVYWMGLTADRLLAYVALVRLGWVEPWTSLARHQARFSGVREAVTRWCAASLYAPAEERFRGLLFLRDTRKLTGPGSKRFRASGERERFGAALDGVGPDHPVLRALAAAVRDLRQRRIPILVYVSPANVEHLERVGLLGASEGDGLARTLGSVEAVVREAGGRYADLHALLPDDAFRDPSGHFTVKAGRNGTRRVAEAITRALAVELLGQPKRR